MASWTEPAATVEAYMKGLSGFAHPVVEKLRNIILSEAPQLEEAIRWNAPSYKGRLMVCSINAFQKHVSLIFARGAELPDPKGFLQQGQGRTAMRTAKYTDLSQVDEKMVRSWLKTAIKLDSTGGTVAVRPTETRPEAIVPELLDKALKMKKHAKAKATFLGLTPSGRREYCEWIASAKQLETTQLRVQKSLEKLMDGEGLNDRYRA
jgi:uncharacterized protein YdeI (YjbR/CyaY-like superfamily)